MSSVFVQIASYHDYELQNTIYDAIEKSSKENDIYFGVHSVYYKNNNVKIPQLENVRYIMSKAPNNLGAGMGRYLAHYLYNNEDYYLQIDSHSRFLPNWDKLLIEDIDYYKTLGFKKPALSAYPAPYFFDEDENLIMPKGSPQNIEFVENDSFSKYLAPGNRGSIEDPVFRQKSVSAAFLFVAGPFMDVNKHLNFGPQEEFAIGLRLFTRGHDLLRPRVMAVYHYYYPYPLNKFNSPKRKNVWEDKGFHKTLEKLQNIGIEEHKNMIRTNKIGRYWLGEERSLQDYGDLVGIDFASETISYEKKMSNEPF